MTEGYPHIAAALKRFVLAAFAGEFTKDEVQNWGKDDPFIGMEIGSIDGDLVQEQALCSAHLDQFRSLILEESRWWTEGHLHSADVEEALQIWESMVRSDTSSKRIPDAGGYPSAATQKKPDLAPSGFNLTLGPTRSESSTKVEERSGEVWCDDVSARAALSQAEEFSAGLLQNSSLCRRLLKLQSLVEDPSTISTGMWECSEPSLNLRLLGRLRQPTPEEDAFHAVIELSCRGTKSIENWVTNFTAGLSLLKFVECEGQAHEGFATAYASLRSQLFINIDMSLTSSAPGSGRPLLVYVIGHSLGGALATLAAYDLATSRGYKVRCITWGSPRVITSRHERVFKLGGKPPPPTF